MCGASVRVIMCAVCDRFVSCCVIVYECACVLSTFMLCASVCDICISECMWEVRRGLCVPGPVRGEQRSWRGQQGSDGQGIQATCYGARTCS